MNEESQANLIAQMDEAINPDMVPDWKEYHFPEKEYPAFGGRTFKIKPLAFKWDHVFRKYAMPIMGAGMQPIEILISTMLGGATDAAKLAAGLTRAIVVNELTIDDLLPVAAGAVFASQSEYDERKISRMDFAKQWAEKCGDLPRETLMEMVEEQLKIQKAMHSLGKSLSTRFESLGKLVDKEGNALNLSSLLLGLMRPATRPSALTGPTDLTSSRSSTTSTGKPTTTGAPIRRVVQSGAKA